MDIPDESGAPQSEAGVRITKHCINCGAEIDINAVICPSCGVTQKTGGGFVQRISGSTTEELRSEPIDKDPKLAAILGLLGGLIIGYWYIGLLKRGIVVTLLMLLSWFTVIGGVIVYAVGVYDIYKLSKNEPAPFDILNKWNLG